MAEQFFDGGCIPEGVCTCPLPSADIYYGSPDKHHIHTLEGRAYVSDGDFIIIGVHGEKYPCKPDIFYKTYESCE